MYFSFHVKYQLLFFDSDKLEYSGQIFEITQILNFMKIRPVGAELLHADGRIDMTKELRFSGLLRSEC
jgi:hypothetical protein